MPGMQAIDRFIPRRFRANPFAMIRNHAFRLSLFVCALGLTWLVLAGSLRAQDYVTVMPTSPLTIVTADGTRHDFIVELAETPEDRARGLMFRETLPLDRGMLFNYRSTRRVSMWMKNTLIPLDMLFIDRKGVITTIRERAIPHSLVAIPSRGKVLSVLELPGGTVDRLGIQLGDVVEHPVFSGS